jgi:hypothetical protein
MSEASELKNITISERANEICELLKEDGYFHTAQQAYRAAIFLAISKELPIDASVKMTLNKWDTAAVFRSNEQNVESAMLLHGFKSDEIVSKGKLLAEAGLRFLGEKITANADILSILIG